MLKKFLLNTLSSFVGAWLALGLTGVAAVIVGVAMMAKCSFTGGEPTPSVNTSHSILKLDLGCVITESENAEPISISDLAGGFSRPKSMTLRSVVTALREGADNKNIDILYIEAGGAMSAGPATVNAIRQEVEAFKKSGKKVYAYGDSFSQSEYYIASAADSIFLNPQGSLDLSGLGSASMFFKGLLDKLGIEYQVVKVGTYKSAVEPYLLEHMSEPARAQLDTLYTTMWQYISDDICKARSISSQKLNSMINNDILFTQDAAYMKANKLVDRLVYKRELPAIFESATGQEPKKQNVVTTSQFLGSVNQPNNYNAKRRVAVVYAVGEISEATSSGINCHDLVPVITDLADDDKVEAMVLRVNSPGGSVFGSEQIREALAYFKSKGKPLAVSMGDYAASGGYWISAGADRIFADPLTITGSIGIFGMIPNAQGLLDKVGLGISTVSTNPNGQINVPLEPLNQAQLDAMQANVNRGYDQFISVVSKGRNLAPQKVRTIGEGRVWNAMTAEKLGLVDELGSLDDAVKWVAKKADLGEDYNLAYYPEAEPNFWSVLQTISENSEARALKNLLGPDTSDEVLYILYTTLYKKPLQSRLYLEVRL